MSADERTELDRLLQAIATADASRTPRGIAVAARITMSAQALNNEGSRGTNLLARQVSVVHDGVTVQVNAVSGDTIKHAFVDHLRDVIESYHDRDAASIALMPISEPARKHDPSRIDSSDPFKELTTRHRAEIAKLKGNKQNQRQREANIEVAAFVARECSLTDVAGTLTTRNDFSVPRHSIARFGWQLSLPKHFQTDNLQHGRFDPVNIRNDLESATSGENIGQMIFHRPASSGIYAFVSLIDLDRIGVSDLTHEAVISPEAQRARQRAVLEALFHTVISPGGAQRNTQLPHVQAVQGAVSVSLTRIPPIIFSPLSADYIEKMERCTTRFGRHDDFYILRFDDADELGLILSEIAETIR